jgi:hypothetical protein
VKEKNVNTNLNSPAGGDSLRQFYNQDSSLYKSQDEQKEPVEEFSEAEIGLSREDSKNEDCEIDQPAQNVEEQLENQSKSTQLERNKAKTNAIFSKYLTKDTKKNLETEEELTLEIRNEKHLREQREAKKQEFKKQLKKTHKHGEHSQNLMDKTKQIDANRINPQA